MIAHRPPPIMIPWWAFLVLAAITFGLVLWRVDRCHDRTCVIGVPKYIEHQCVCVVEPAS